MKKYLVEYYCVENGVDSVDYFDSFISIESVLDFVRFLLSTSTPDKYFIISEISIVNDNFTNYFQKD